MKHVTPPTNGTPVELDLPTTSIDAYSASPALRLRWQVLAAKASQRLPEPVLPPPVGEPRQEFDCDDNAVAKTFDDGNVLARLMMLRAHAAAEVERLICFLDETDGILDDEDDGEGCRLEDGEEDLSDNEPSLGWAEGVAQGQGRWGGADDRETAAEPAVTDADRRAYFRKRHGNVLQLCVETPTLMFAVKHD